MVRIVYLCERKGLPSLDEQRAVLAEAGLRAEELADAYVEQRRKPKAGETAQQVRDHVVGAARNGDEVWVSRPSVLATTEVEALRLAAAISAHGAKLCIASTGQCYRVPKAVAGSLLLVAAIREDERASVMAKARKGLHGKPAGKPKVDPEKLKTAERHWFNPDIDGDEAARRSGISRRRLHSEYGPRNTPAFGKKEDRRK